MSTELITFNLTHYTSLRTLELQYSKVRDQNATLRHRLTALEDLYRNQMNSFNQTRDQWIKKQKKATVGKSQINKELNQLIECICQIENELIKIDKMGIDLGIEEMSTTTERMGLTQSQKAKQKTVFIKKCLIELIGRNNQQAVNYEKEISLMKQDVRTIRQNQKQLKQQVVYLEEQLCKMERSASHLQNELSQTKREYVDYKLKFYQEPSREEQKQNKSEQMLQDNNFALDLLNFQKQLLQKIFNKMLSSLQNDTLTQTFSDIYSSYQSVCSLFRQKLQIQYDLQDLQRQYKKEKNSKISENLLIELRKQIEQFRSQLAKQKQTLSKEEETLEQTFVELRAAQKDQKRMRTYTLQVQKKLKDIQEHKSTKNNVEKVQEQTRIKFRPTQTTEQLMKEVVRKDRQNLQRILRETRMGYMKQTIDA